MQTFLPYADFEKTAACLDYRRLGKQRAEAKQILKALTVPGYGWGNHTAVLMWRGYELALCDYLNHILYEWIEVRGFKNVKIPYTNLTGCRVEYPHWLGNEDFHSGQRSNLLRKKYSHYSQFGWEESDDLPYIWPKGKY